MLGNRVSVPPSCVLFDWQKREEGFAVVWYSSAMVVPFTKKKKKKKKKKKRSQFICLSGYSGIQRVLVNSKEIL